MIALWKIQNDKRHGWDKETSKAARHEVLTNKLKVMYTNQDQYPPAVHNLLQQSFKIYSSRKAS
jgi:hypothetical protein